MADEEVTSANNNDEVFEYMGRGMVSLNVACARVHPSVTTISRYAFQYCFYLEEIELCEGLLEIGEFAFFQCISLKHVNIPSTAKTIGKYAFCKTPLHTLNLPDSVESIGDHAFCHGRFPTVRIPPLVTTIFEGTFFNCSRMFSAELPETITQMVEGRNMEDAGIFENCRSLRNVAIPPQAAVGTTFEDCKDLLQLFDSESQIRNALKHRFDNLPIHKMIYYQSYNNLTSEQLRNAIKISSSQTRSHDNLNPTGNQKDCLGMTPLHVLACSSVHHLELYQVLIEKYPTNLIVKDKWGTVPLLYAVWGNASSEIVQLLVEKYLSIYPDYEFDWTGMVTTLGERSAPESSIKSLLDVQKVSFPAQKIDWDRVLDIVANVPVNPYDKDDESLKSTLQCLVKINTVTRVNAIGIKLWRDDMAEMMAEPIPHKMSKRDWLSNIKSKLCHYEAKYRQLKEATTILELALWKTKLDELNGQIKGKAHSKKRKIDDLDFRKQCRVNCSADFVIEHVLPYLLPAIEVAANDT